MRGLWKKIIFSVPFILFVLISGLDALLFFVGKIPEIVRILREGILITILVLLWPVTDNFSIIKAKNVSILLRNLALTTMIAFFVFVLTNSAYPTLTDGGMATNQILAFIQKFIIATLSALTLVLIAIIMLRLLNYLVFYKSKKHTARNFRFLLFSIVTFVVVNSIQGKSGLEYSDFLGNNAWRVVSTLFLIISILLNATRTSWINFLNRKKKWLSFLLSPVLFIFAVHIITSIRDSYLLDYSVAWTSILYACFLFLAVYAFFCIVSLIFHLPTAGLFDDKVQAIKSLQYMTQSISLFMDKKGLMRELTSLVIKISKSDAAWVEMYNEKDDELFVTNWENLSDDEVKMLKQSRQTRLRLWMLANRKQLTINDISRDDRAHFLMRISKPFGAFIATPIVTGSDFYGVLYAATTSILSYDQSNEDVIQSLAGQAAVALKNAELVKTSIEKERLAEELKIAHETQAKLLPRTMPDIPGLDIAAVSIAAKEVGGDYFDLKAKDNTLSVIVGDVSGKGSAAAFYMAEVKGVVEAFREIYDSPRDILIHTNRVLYHSLEKQLFITLLSAMFDAKTHEVNISRAGHSPLLWCPKGEMPQFLDPKGIGIGLDDGTIFEEQIAEMTVQGGPGDYFVFYTDGVVEARNSELKEFEEEALIDILKNHEFENSQKTKDYILHKIHQHLGNETPHDDFTLVVVGFK